LYLINLIKTKGDKEMKVVVRLAVIVAALLVISNLAFAGATTCTGDQVVCYNITGTYPDGATFGPTTYKFCLNDDGTGNLCTGGGCYDYLKAFGGGTGWYNFDGAPQFGGNPNWSVWVVNYSLAGFSGIYQPIGEGYLLTGVETPGPTFRAIVNGIKIKCP
jgi:hypothetical protein